MWLATELAVFARVLQLGSFTAAARSLGVPKVAVSRAILSLEQRFGTRLLTRTTRRMAITPAGELLRPYCDRLLGEVEAARLLFTPTPASGAVLRILTDTGYGRLLTAPLVPRFMEHHADVPLQVGLLDAASFVTGQENPDWDVLIGNGAAPGGSLVITRLGSPPLLLCATAAYLATHGQPRDPTELARHVLLVAGDVSGAGVLKLRSGSREVDVPLAPQLRVNDPAIVHASAAAGLGVGVLPEFLCRQGLSLGRLQRVLPDWLAADSLQLYAACDPRRAGDERIRRFIDFMSANMAPVLATT